MNISSYPREKIQEGLKKARLRHRGFNDQIRLLFSPTKINSLNFDRACDVYSRIDLRNYETVVIVESYHEVLDKKLPMASHKYFDLPLGRVTVNDSLRNEFCDEDDDFFIYDGAFHGEMSLFDQLTMLRCCGTDFSAVSVQIADPGPEIVKECAYVLEEVLVSRSALLVFCCKLDNSRENEFARVKAMIENKNHSELLNYLNSGESHIEGSAAFIAGTIVANSWELKLNFLTGEYEDYSGSLLTAYADRQRVLF